MAESQDEHMHRVIAAAGEIVMDAARALRDSAWMPQELAAQLAERVACHDVPEGTAHFIDGWVAACEAVAAEIRAYAAIRKCDAE